MTDVVSQCTTDCVVGTKYDQNKPRVGEMFLDFSKALEYTAKVWEFGAKKYGKGNWKYVVNARNRYTNALLRHLAAESTCEWDNETHLMHAAHVAWNALARLHFILESTRPVDFSIEEDNNEKAVEKIQKAALPLEEGKDILDSLVTESISDDGYEQLKLDLKFDKVTHD